MLYVFGDHYTLDPACYELCQYGRLVRLEPRVFDCLAYLVQHPDRMVPKEELIEQLWPQQFVADDSLTTCVAQARKALGDTGQTQRYIQTVRRRGYRFIAPVTVRPPAATDAPSPPPATPKPTAWSSLDPAAAVSPPAAVQAAPPSGVPPAPDPARLARATGPGTPDAERRQLTVLFCDLVESTVLASQLDPEDYREVVRAYHQTCAKVIARFDGHIAQYLGDGLLVYFGYPQAHEDDAQRAVRTGLGIVEALGPLNARLEHDKGIRVAVRVGIHTGLAVVGALGGGERQEQLALGETPNIAARLQGLAAPDTVVISAATARLVAGYFVCQPLGVQALKGVSEPLQVSRVLRESGAQTRLDVATPRGLTPLVGRDEEVALLHRRWDQAKTGLGQVVLLSGEAGIGKSRLVQVLKDHVAAEPHTRIEWRASPYHQQSAFYPLIDHLHRLLRWHPDSPPPETLHTLEATLTTSGMSLSEAVPLLAALLSLPLPASYLPLTLTPQRQRQKTLETLLTWLHAEAQRQPVLCVVEDLHWVDPSTLELLSLLIDQGAQARLCLVLTARPEFHPPWALEAHLTTLTLRRLAPDHVARVATHVAGNKALPPAVLQEMVRKTDGVPLFVEELTKMVLESGLLEEPEDRYTLYGPLPPLAIPATLQDSLMARLDRLGSVKRVAQLGATIGRQFAYDLLQAVCPLDVATVQAGLRQLVEVELCYQRGVPPHATYLFKHALIQEVAYQSLLKSTRQHYHQRIAQVLEAQFPETVALQPELLAQHYTAAGCSAQAVVYWQRAGQRALERSAHREATVCFEQALGAVQHLPEHQATREQAIDLHFSLRNALLPLGEHEQIFAHLCAAQSLAEVVHDERRLGRACAYLAEYFRMTGDSAQAVAAGERAFALATALGDCPLEVLATLFLGTAYHALGDYRRAVDCFRRNVSSLTGELMREHFGMTGLPAVMSRTWLVWCLAELGAFAEGAVRGAEAVRLAEAVEDPFSLTQAYSRLGGLYLCQGDLPQAIPALERSLALCQSANILTWLPTVAAPLGYAYTLAGRVAEGLPLLQQAAAQDPSRGLSAGHARWVAYLSEAYLRTGHMDEATSLARSALAFARARKARGNEAYALRLLGEIQAHQDPPAAEAAEATYRQALALAAELGMRPLLAHCHLGLGTLSTKGGRLAQARAALSIAIELFQTMAMTFWLPRAEATLAQTA